MTKKEIVITKLLDIIYLLSMSTSDYIDSDDVEDDIENILKDLDSNSCAICELYNKISKVCPVEQGVVNRPRPYHRGCLEFSKKIK